MCKLPFWMPIYAVSAKEQEKEKEKDEKEEKDDGGTRQRQGNVRQEE
jgi:hypothetical protein